MEEASYAGLPVLAIGRVAASGVTLLGTGFAVRTGIIATAAHVVGHDDSNLVGVLPPNSTSGYQDTTNNSIITVPLRLAGFDPVKDVAILEAAAMTMSIQPDLDTADSSPPGTPIVTLGYPHADTGRLVLTHHSAQVGARVLLGSSSSKVKHIVLNIQTRPGQSGSPVVMGQKIVAMVTGAYRPSAGSGILLAGIDPATLHQTTHAVSAEYIREML